MLCRSSPKTYKFISDEHNITKAQTKKIKGDKLKKPNVPLISDFGMNDHTNAVKVTPDGNYVFLLGAHKPMIRCYEFNDLSMKFERGCDAEPKKIQFINNDYSNFVLWEGQTDLTLHDKGGIYRKVRSRSAITDISYSLDNDLLVSQANGKASKLNLTRGKIYYDYFTANTENEPITRCVYEPTSRLFSIGMTNGVVKFWDIRSKQPEVLSLKFDFSYFDENYHDSSKIGISDLTFKSQNEWAFGSEEGFIQMFDLRNAKIPKTSYALELDAPAIGMKYFDDKFMVASRTSIKVLELSNMNEEFLSVSTEKIINDLDYVPDSGMFFIATEGSRIETIFSTSLGNTPSWMPHINSLLTNTEAKGVPLYPNRVFLTREDIEKYNLGKLKGTTQLIPHTHGYYIHEKQLKLIKAAHTKQQKEDEKLVSEIKTEIITKKKPELVNDEELVQITNMFMFNKEICVDDLVKNRIDENQLMKKKKKREEIKNYHEKSIALATNKMNKPLSVNNSETTNQSINKRKIEEDSEVVVKKSKKN